MNKILNWVFGSFFRTIGRTIAFLVIGALLFYFISNSDIEIPDFLSDIFFIKVKALELNTNVDEMPPKVFYYQNSDITIDGFYGRKLLERNSFLVSYEIQIDPNTYDQESMIDYIEVPFMIGQAKIVYGDTPDGHDYPYICQKWVPDNVTTGGYKCDSMVQLPTNTKPNTTKPIAVLNETSFNFFVEFVSGGIAQCELKNGAIQCPTQKQKVKGLMMNYTFRGTAEEDNAFVWFGMLWTRYSKNNSTTQAIQDQTQQNHQDSVNTQNSINNVTDSITNNNTDDASNSASGFFDNFNDNDHGLSSIITAPLRAINSMLNDTCVAPGATYKGQSFSLPCGSMLWNRDGGQDFRNFINIMYGGFLAYFVIRSLFLDIEKLKNPNNDKVEVESL